METIEFYNTILINTYEGIYFVDDPRQITFWNGGAERITGYPAGEVLGKRCADNLLSVGASLVQEGDTVETLMKRADEMQYVSKEKGRNMVMFG